MDEILAQSALFFLAGFETSATAITFALLELALNQDVQDKLRNDITEVLEQHDGEITYEAIMDMKYLDMTIHGKFFKCCSIRSIQHGIRIWKILKSLCLMTVFV